MNVSKEPTTPNHNPGDTVEVDDLDHFVTLLIGWHTNKVKVLQHMATLPEGTEMESEDGIKLMLSGDVLAGFQAGIGLALMELGTLPFAVEPETEPEAKSADAPKIEH